MLRALLLYKSYIPSADDITLRFAYGNIIAYKDKFDMISLLWMKSNVLFFSQPEIQYVAGVIPNCVLIESSGVILVNNVHFTMMTVL